MQLATAWFGVALLDGDRVVKKVAFPQEPEGIAERLQRVHAGEVLDEEREAVAGVDAFEVFETRLVRLPGARLGVGVGPRLAARASEFGASRASLHAAALELGRRRYRAQTGGRDAHVLMAVDAVDDLAEVANLMSERLREWYGLHYPELDRLDRHEEYAALVAEHVTNDAIRGARPDLPEPALGAPLPAPEAESVRALARLASRVYSTRADLEGYLARTMPEIAPNLTRLLGPSLAARLVRLAGGLQALARMPAGTIQTLGAEKALFRHLKEGKRPPKHGVLLQHPFLHRALRRSRGPIARALAGKVTLAARADAFTHATLPDAFFSDLEARTREIERERARPPRAGPPRGPRGPRGGPRRGPPFREGRR